MNTRNTNTHAHKKQIYTQVDINRYMDDQAYAVSAFAH